MTRPLCTLIQLRTAALDKDLPRDLVEAYAWVLMGIKAGAENLGEIRKSLEGILTDEQQSAARKRSDELRKLYDWP